MPATLPVDRDAIRAGDTITYAPLAGFAAPDGDLSAVVEYTTSDACHIIRPDGGLRYPIAWGRVTGHTPRES